MVENFEITEQITEVVEHEIVEAKKQSYNKLLEIIITAIFLCGGIALFCFDIIGLPALALILFGALWNFFTDANKLFACIMAFLVCTIFGIYAVRAQMYGQAFLHIAFYLPTQLIYYFENQKEEDVSILPNKELNPVALIGSCVALVLLAFCLSLVLYELGEPYYLSDGVCTALLMLSVFLSNGRYKEYFAVRIGACAVAVIVWLYVAIENGFADSEAALMALFLMYLIMDAIKFVRWEIKNKDKLNSLKSEKIKQSN